MSDLHFIITATPNSRFRAETPPFIRLRHFLKRLGHSCGLEVSDVKHEGEAPSRPSELDKPKRIRKQSPAQRKKQAEWNQITQRKIAAGMLCEVRVPHICTRRITEGHHVRPKGLGGKWTEDNHLGTCRPCHEFIKANREWALMAGVLK